MEVIFLEFFYSFFLAFIMFFSNFASAKPDYVDHSLKPAYPDMTIPKHDNADDHYTPINVLHTPLGGGAAGLGL